MFGDDVRVLLVNVIDVWFCCLWLVKRIWFCDVWLLWVFCCWRRCFMCCCWYVWLCCVCVWMLVIVDLFGGVVFDDLNLVYMVVSWFEGWDSKEWSWDWLLLEWFCRWVCVCCLVVFGMVVGKVCDGVMGVCCDVCLVYVLNCLICRIL